MGPLLTYLFHCAICFDSKVSFCTNIYGKPVPIRTSLWPRNISVYITSKGPFLISMSICSGKKKREFCSHEPATRRRNKQIKTLNLEIYIPFFGLKTTTNFHLKTNNPGPWTLKKSFQSLSFLLSPFFETTFWKDPLGWEGPNEQLPDPPWN